MKSKSATPLSSQDKIRENLRRLITDHNVDMATVSRAIGKNHAYIQQYLTRGVPSELSYSTALSLAQYFGAPLDQFGIQTFASNDKGQKQHPVQTVRTMLGLSVAQFAHALNTSEKTIQDIENFSLELTETLLLRICRTFRIDPADLRDYVPQFTEAERNLIYSLRRMTPEQIKTVQSMMQKWDSEAS